MSFHFLGRAHSYLSCIFLVTGLMDMFQSRADYVFVHSAGCLLAAGTLCSSSVVHKHSKYKSNIRASFSCLLLRKLKFLSARMLCTNSRFLATFPCEISTLKFNRKSLYLVASLLTQVFFFAKEAAVKLLFSQLFQNVPLPQDPATTNVSFFLLNILSFLLTGFL